LEDEDDHGIISGESGDEFMEAARKWTHKTLHIQSSFTNYKRTLKMKTAAGYRS
jgi:hypothetical protein